MPHNPDTRESPKPNRRGAFPIEFAPNKSAVRSDFELPKWEFLPLMAVFLEA